MSAVKLILVLVLLLSVICYLAATANTEHCSATLESVCARPIQTKQFKTFLILRTAVKWFLWAQMTPLSHRHATRRVPQVYKFEV